MAVTERISDHAVKRIRERLGINKSAAQREAERAADGMRIDECVGRLRRYLDAQRHRCGFDADYRVTPSGVFAYRFGTLATVWPIPPAFRKSALAQWKRWQASND